MIYSIALLTSSGLLYLIHFLVGASSFRYGNKVISLMMGVALIGMILSGSCFFMNMGNMKLKKKKVKTVWMVLSSIAFTLFMGYIGLILVERAAQMGASFF